MKCKIEKSILNGKIICPANKSYTHRAIFLAALSDGKSIIKKILRANDTIATINASRAFGVNMDESNETSTLTNSIGDTTQISNIVYFDGQKTIIHPEVKPSGFDNRNILGEIGYTQEEINQFINTNTIFDNNE